VLQKLFPKLKQKDLLLHGIVLLGVLGMGCILFSSFFRTEETDKQPEADTVSNEDYRLQIQDQLTQILSRMEGVGEVEVLVTVEGSEEYHYAKQGDSLVTDEQVKKSSTYVTVGGTSKEALVESVTHPVITGVVVACEGGDRSTVRENVYKAAAVACGISSAQIYVTKMESN
jgi:stage III sporulation protein AG